MKTRHAMIVLAAVCAAFALAPRPAAAHGPGSGLHARSSLFGYVRRFQFHTPRPLRFHPPRNRHHVQPVYWPWYGGAFGIPYRQQPATVTQPMQPVPVKNCRYVKQTVTVPAEAGGSTQVTVTRC
jgi:hypothetical protein